MKTIMVAGSAHLDVLGRAIYRDDVIDKVGSFSIDFGGTAFNIAVNLAHSGVKVRFLTAMNGSVYSKGIEAFLVEAGIEPHIDFNDALPTAGFTAHVDTKGEMFSAISEMPVERASFSDARIAGAMDGCRAVVMDCNLSPVVLNRLVTFANDRGIPAYIAAVSEEKSLRISGVSGRVKGLFLNWREYRFFIRSLLGSVMSVEDAARALQSTILVTQGSSGSTLANPDGTSKHIPAADVGDDGSRLGMGDALAAGVVLMHEVHGLPLDEAATRALKLASAVGASRHCHPGRGDALESAIERFHYRAGHDAMTGVLNRYTTELELSKSLERQKRGATGLSVLLMDIDHFKSINDTYGHNTGDDVIVRVTQAAQSCLRENDYVGRWGGEEFIIVLPDTPHEAALRVADRVRAAVESSVRDPRPVTVSVGCCEAIGTVASDIRSLIERADQALYEAKRGGRNRVVCASALAA